MKLQKVSIKNDPNLGEKWVQDQIAESPGILELGDLVLRDKERIQAGAGRLDLLLQNPDTLKRYVVEIQLGAVDAEHIIRTIEYWDIESKRYPNYEHTAVIIAEDITSRFLNVISLFNGRIPLIALKMTAYNLGSDVCLTFVKVLDEVNLGLVEDDEPIAEPTDRNFWELKSSKQSLSFVDQLMTIVNEVEPKAVLKYNKHYIGLGVGGIALNFISFAARKTSVTMTFKLPKDESFDSLIDEAGLESLEYGGRAQRYRIRIPVGPNISEQAKSAILELAKKSRELFGR